MKASLLAATTVLAWTFGITLTVVGFTGSPVERLADRAYPVVLVLVLAGIIGYVFDALNNPRVPNEKRKLWAVVLVLAHWFAQPFYWWWYLRPQNA
jgi:hypothetical protein